MKRVCTLHKISVCSPKEARLSSPLSPQLRLDSHDKRTHLPFSLRRHLNANRCGLAYSSVIH